MEENGFTLEAYDARWTDASFLGVRFRIPNTRRHRFAIMLHDLHHVATGFGTDLVGEGEISAWELRRGLRGLDLYVTSIVASGALMGAVFAPRRALAAWRASGKSSSLFASVQSDGEYHALLDTTVATLRRRLDVPDEGIQRTPRNLHAYAPKPRRLTRPSERDGERGRGAFAAVAALEERAVGGHQADLQPPGAAPRRERPLAEALRQARADHRDAQRGGGRRRQ